MPKSAIVIVLWQKSNISVSTNQKFCIFQESLNGHVFKYFVKFFFGLFEHTFLHSFDKNCHNATAPLLSHFLEQLQNIAENERIKTKISNPYIIKILKVFQVSPFIKSLQFLPILHLFLFEASTVNIVDIGSLSNYNFRTILPRLRGFSSFYSNLKKNYRHFFFKKIHW